MEQAALASLTQDDKKRIAQEPSSAKPPRLPSKIELQRREYREQKQKVLIFFSDFLKFLI